MPSTDKGLFDELAEMLELGWGLDRIEPELWARFGAEMAMVVIDSSGFTRTTLEKGVVSFLASLVSMRKIAAQILNDYQHHSHRFEADNFYAEFGTVEAALRASLRIEAEVSGGRAGLISGGSYRLCIGMGYGKVLRSDSQGVFGPEMNLASKLGEDIAGAGEVLLTENAWKQLPENLRGKFSSRSRRISGLDLHYRAAAADSIRKLL